MVISGRKCPTCVSKEVKEMQKILGIIIGVSAAILTVLMIILFIHNMIVENKKKGKAQERIKKVLR